jgi:hemerythrin-like domain-containing protein
MMWFAGSAKMKCIELLNEEHHVLLRLFKLIKAMADGAAAHRDIAKEDVEGAVRLLDTYVNSAHETKEESALFPVLMRRAGPETRKQLQACTFEHNQERSLLEGMRDSIKTGNCSDFAYCAGRLAELLMAHVRKEYVLFAECKALLTPEDDRDIVEDFARFDAESRPRLQDQSALLVRLEKKYRNAA